MAYTGYLYGTMNMGTARSLGVTCADDQYPNGDITIGGATFYATSGISDNVTYYFDLYLCDSSGNSKYKITRVNITSDGAGRYYGHTTIYSGSVSGAKGLRGKALYLIAEYAGNSAGASYPAGVSSFEIRAGSGVSFSIPTSNAYSASSFSAGNVNFGDTSTVSITINSVSNDVWHRVTWSVGSYSSTVDTASGGTSASLQIPESWMNAIPSSTSASLTINVATYRGNTQIGNTASTIVTASVKSSVVPTVSIALAIANQHAQGAFANQYVQSLTGVSVTTTASGVNGSTISNSNVSITVSPTETATKSGMNFSINALKNSGTVSITVTVVDSRGRQASDTKTITVVAYHLPVFRSTSAYRANDEWLADETGTYAVIRAVFDYASQISGNTLTVNSVYYVYEGQEETAVNNMTNGTDYLIGDDPGESGALNPAYTYRVKFTATDTIGGTTTVVTVVQTAAYAIHVMNGGTGVAFGKACENGNAVEINEGWDLWYKGMRAPAFIYYVPTQQEPTPPNPFEGLVWLKPKQTS